MKNITVISLIFFCSLFPIKLLGWGQQGHRIIGELANNMLSSSARKKINKVLAGASIPMVSNWGDFIKADTAFNQFSNWHYTNFDRGLIKEQFDSAAITTNNGECVFRVIYLTEYLKNHYQDTEKLKLLIHLIGDMFQPLHLGQKKDLGGNRTAVKWFKQNTNLHVLWDTKLIDFQQLSYTEYANHLQRLYKPVKTIYSKQLVLQAAWDTYTVASKIYESVKSYSKEYRYIYDYKTIWEQQLVASSILLATILEYIY